MRIPFYVPTVTGRTQENYPIVLCSPSQKKPLVYGRIHTLVDCHTYYLRYKKKCQHFAMDHYLWYLEFLKRHKHQWNLTFISVDYDWLPPGVLEQVASAYASLDHDAYRWLAIPNTIEFERISEPVGYAFPGRTENIVHHPVWTHTLSKNIRHIPTSTFWTYDSASPYDSNDPQGLPIQDSPGWT